MMSLRHILNCRHSSVGQANVNREDLRDSRPSNLKKKRALDLTNTKRECQLLKRGIRSEAHVIS
jgi:hypothetical protein